MENFLANSFLGNSVKDWLIALGIALGAIVVARTLYWVMENYIKKLTEKTETKIDDILINTVERPMVAASGIAGVWFGVNYLSFSESIDHWINAFFAVIITFIGAWLVTRLFDSLVDEYLAPILADTETDLDDILLPIVRRGVKIIIWIMAVIMALDNAGYDITTVLAGLGVGGLALALAAQDSAKNIFGVFTIFTDTPFKLGDRVKVSGHDGTVTEIGLRSTKIKTLEGRIVVVPNSKFSDNAIENVSSEPSRKVVLNLGLTYDMDDTKVEEAMQILRDIVGENGEAIEEKPSVGFNAFGDFALNVVFVYYIKKGADILGTQTAVNLAILKRFGEKGIELAFPTQTILNKKV
ncbi:MAG: transporter [Verrucomicrobiales bacterium]|nr:transporter [Verrucomicrobiales bacterium]|tara:strand:+ start:2821 stop:3879 length:1059 start_codon:yes stop_codon:yes gene_type:complete